MSSSNTRFEKYPWDKWSNLIKLQDYVVLDVETTGLSPKTDKIIEISILKVRNGIPVDTYTSLVTPGKNLSSRITKLTGLTDSDLADAPPFCDIAKTVSNFIGQNLILAHNAPFDLNFISKAMSECDIKFDPVYIDTMQLARKAYPQFEKHKLEYLIPKLHLAGEQTHRAADDVDCTWKLFQLICEKFDNPLVDAISSCCFPISDYLISVQNSPLLNTRLALVGSLTFSYAAAKKLIGIAGGTLVDIKSPDLDYIVYGYIDPEEHPLKSSRLIQKILTQRGHEAKPRFINEVALLRLCGVSFFDEIGHFTEEDLN